jgi:hypothetical protein
MDDLIQWYPWIKGVITGCCKRVGFTGDRNSPSGLDLFQLISIAKPVKYQWVILNLAH